MTLSWTSLNDSPVFNRISNDSYLVEKEIIQINFEISNTVSPKSIVQKLIFSDLTSNPNYTPARFSQETVHPEKKGQSLRHFPTLSCTITLAKIVLNTFCLSDAKMDHVCAFSDKLTSVWL